MGLSNNNAFGSVLAQGHWSDPRQGWGAVIKLMDIFPHVFYVKHDFSTLLTNIKI